ncbi:hypothetical protein D3C86_1916970 [compost metagenome]
MKVAAPLERRTQLDFHLLTDMTGELLQREQRSVHAGRRHLEGVLRADRILDIENTTDLPTDLLAIFDENAIGMIDINSQQRMPPLRQELDTPAFIAECFDYRGHQGLQLF